MEAGEPIAKAHQLELMNGQAQFRTTVNVNIQPGKTTRATVAVPNGTVSINALPWANVWLDGRELGATPIASQTVPIGPHEVIWRHPQLGERKQTVIVPANGPLRLMVDFGK